MLKNENASQWRQWEFGSGSCFTVQIELRDPAFMGLAYEFSTSVYVGGLVMVPKYLDRKQKRLLLKRYDYITS
jgi:hypothetical protein